MVPNQRSSRAVDVDAQIGEDLLLLLLASLHLIRSKLSIFALLLECLSLNSRRTSFGVRLRAPRVQSLSNAQLALLRLVFAFSVSPSTTLSAAQLRGELLRAHSRP